MQYEYSLVVFTIFGQLAVGIALLVALTGLYKEPEKERQAWLMALISGVIAAVGSALHVSSFWGTPYLITQLGSSWIALEVAAGAVFGLLVLLRILQKISPALNALVAIVGLCFVGIMAQVYKADIIPLWNTCGTELSFFGTTFLLGSVFVAPLLAFKIEEQPSRICAAFFLIGVLASASLPLFWIQGLVPLVALEVPALASFLGVSLCLGLGMLGLHILGGLPLVMDIRYESILYSGAILVLVGSFMGRMLFYAANIKLGIM